MESANLRSIGIRKITAADYNYVTHTWKMVAHTPLAKRLQMDKRLISTFQPFLMDWALKEFTTLIAYDLIRPGKILGFINGCLANECVLVHNIYVRTGARGYGIGQTLFDTLSDHTRKFVVGTLPSIYHLVYTYNPYFLNPLICDGHLHVKPFPQHFDQEVVLPARDEPRPVPAYARNNARSVPEATRQARRKARSFIEIVEATIPD